MNKKELAKRAKYMLRFLPDETYIKLYFRLRMGKPCNLDNPKTFNEKLQWLKLYDRRPEYTDMVDKCEAKTIAARVIGAEHIVPTLGVYDRFEDIDFDKLPNSFVLKCTHDSEGLVIVRDKTKFDQSEAEKKLKQAMGYNFFWIGREWPYKNVRPRIIAEEYLESAGGGLKDYKFFCFDGEPKAMFVASDRQRGRTKFDYFDMEYRPLGIRQHYPNSESPPKRPQRFADMVAASRTLAAGHKCLRVDFYETEGQWYFGEYTFYHFSGFTPFEPERWDTVFGEWIVL